MTNSEQTTRHEDPNVTEHASRAGARYLPRHAALSALETLPSGGTTAALAMVGVVLSLGALSGLMKVGHTSVSLIPAPATSSVPNGGSAETLEDHARVMDVVHVQARSQQRTKGARLAGLSSDGIPNVALNAYRVAAVRIDRAEPSCHLNWTLLAGIGRVESDHGRFGGASLSASGESTPHIIGPALDGTRWDRVVDTDRGVYDGDVQFDHAVGPMQFIPATWAAYGADADGDGTVDPFNVNDAALAAGRYLCAAGGDLRSDEAQRRAVRAYNNNDSYISLVLDTASYYASGVPITGPAHGITSGALPPISASAGQPPANPGPAPAADARSGAGDGSQVRTSGHYSSAIKPMPSGNTATQTTARPPATPAPTTSTSPTSAPNRIPAALAPALCPSGTLLAPLCGR